jgi:hypothetical protein
VNKIAGLIPPVENTSVSLTGVGRLACLFSQVSTLATAEFDLIMPEI